MHIRTDQVDSAFFARELEAVLVATYDRKYAELKGRQLVASNREVQPGEKTFTWKEYDQAGIVKLISDAGTDLPRADVSGKENTGRIDYYANAIGYTVFDVMNAQRLGKPLEQMKAHAARMAHERNFDDCVALGNVKTGTVGLLNQPNFQSYTVPNGAGGDSKFSKKTPREILADLNGMANKIISVTKGAHRAKVLLLPLAQFTLVSTTPMSDHGNAVTIKEFFEKNQPGIRIDHWYRCEGAGEGGADRMVAYDDDPMTIAFMVAQEFEAQPVQARGIEFEIPCTSGAGGVVAFYPLAGIYGDGI